MGRMALWKLEKKVNPSVNTQPRGVVGQRPWTDEFLHNPVNVQPWGVKLLIILHEGSRISNVPTAIEEGEISMLGTSCLNVQYFNYSRIGDDHPTRDG